MPDTSSREPELKITLEDNGYLKVQRFGYVMSLGAATPEKLLGLAEDLKSIAEEISKTKSAGEKP